MSRVSQASQQARFEKIQAESGLDKMMCVSENFLNQEMDFLTFLKYGSYYSLPTYTQSDVPPYQEWVERSVKGKTIHAHDMAKSNFWTWPIIAQNAVSISMEWRQYPELGAMEFNPNSAREMSLKKFLETGEMPRALLCF